MLPATRPHNLPSLLPVLLTQGPIAIFTSEGASSSISPNADYPGSSKTTAMNPSFSPLDYRRKTMLKELTQRKKTISQS